MLTRIDPINPSLQKDPFDDPDWLFEVKYDGFRAVAYIEDDLCKLVSRKGNTFDRFRRLGRSVAADLEGTTAILDGEIACLDDNGVSIFYDLMKGGISPSFCAFDLLYLDGQELHDIPLSERKARLRAVIPQNAGRLLYVDHIEEKGTALYEQICQLDLEGIVAKPADSKYRNAGVKWIKIKNPNYSQLEGRSELFDNKACALTQIKM